jgi:MHS family alpha-ketoglutarate permease-like MFS transporter
LTPFAIRGNGLDDGMVFWALSIATAMFVVLQYPFGWTADQFGRKPQLLVWSGAIALLMVPISTLIRPEAGFGSVLLVFCFGLGLYAMKSSIAPAIMSELLPTELRCLGIGTWYNLTVALFGGTAPLVIQWLSNIGHSSWFFWYVSVGAAVAFAATLTLPETKGSVLR